MDSPGRDPVLPPWPQPMPARWATPQRFRPTHSSCKAPWDKVSRKVVRAGLTSEEALQGLAGREGWAVLVEVARVEAAPAAVVLAAVVAAGALRDSAEALAVVGAAADSEVSVAGVAVRVAPARRAGASGKPSTRCDSASSI